MTVIVAAHNEEKNIRERVRNILTQETRYALEVIVASDGSSDRTAEEAEAAGARVLRLPRRGKVAALHDAVRAAAGEAILITDANTRFDERAIDPLVDVLADAAVGIAAGDLRYDNEGESSSAAGESLYWRYETMIKSAASDAGLLLMGAGGIYAVRKEDWPFDLPADFADDSYVPLSLHRSGRRNLFVSEAKASERAGVTMREEWRRRVRMVAQDVRVARALRFGLPNRDTCFALVSQKVLRWVLFPLGVLTVALPGNPVRVILARRAARLSLLPAAAGCAKLLATPSARRAAMSALYLVGATAAASWGFALGLAGRSRATWDAAPSTR